MIKNVALEPIITRYRENKLAHAYLIETNNLEAALFDLKELIKIINCNQEYEENCQKCNLCNLINKNNLPSIKIIEPDGTIIKKAQIEELKREFSTIPVYSHYNIYIIMQADKLGTSSANSMLKFLEEPTTNIIGFFLTTNKDIIMDTIKSRCQSLNLVFTNKNTLASLSFTPEELEKYKIALPKFLSTIEHQTFLNNKKGLMTEFPDRKSIETIFKLIFLIYYHHFLKLLNEEYDPEILEIYHLNENIETLSKKIQIITQILTEMSYNVNTELIIDKFIIEMRGTK